MIFLLSERDSFFDRWDFMLGTKWTEADLAGLKAGVSKEGDPVPDRKPGDGDMRFPLSLLIRPEIIDSLIGNSVPTTDSLKGMAHIPGGAISLADVDKNEFLQKLGVAPVTDQSFSDKDPSDMFGKPTKHVASGFKEGPMRTIGSYRK